MSKVTQLIPAPSLTEQTRQMILAIRKLPEKQVACPNDYQDRLHPISMPASEAHDTIVDAELFRSDKSGREITLPDY